MKKGLALVPGDRAKEGLLYIRSILENLLVTFLAKIWDSVKNGKIQKRCIKCFK